MKYMKHINGLNFRFTVKDKSDDLFGVVKFTGKEKLSIGYIFKIDLATRSFNLELEDLIGKSSIFEIWIDNILQRSIHGIIYAIEQGSRDDYHAYYAIDFTPYFYTLKLKNNCRIFQEKTILEIISEILQEHNIAYKFKITKRYQKKSYCVQYKETDYNFLQRLVIKEGIFFYFNDISKSSVIVFCDNFNLLEEINLKTKLGKSNFYFKRKKTLSYKRVVLKDYDFKRPKIQLEASTKATKSNFEYFNCFSNFDNRDIDPNIAKSKLAALKNNCDVVKVETCNCKLMLGLNVSDTLSVTEITHTGIQFQSLEEMGGNGSTDYKNSLILSNRLKSWNTKIVDDPIIEGPQLAVVAGPDNNEIYCDSYGRVQVIFFWDRKKNNSCWIRVAQVRASAAHGFFSLPKVGDEVIVSFLNGDPNRPIITGSVYNGDNVAAYSLPQHKTKTVWRSKLYKNDNFNEISFDDKEGYELLSLYAARNYLLFIKDNKEEKIKACKHLVIEKNSYTKVNGEKHLYIDGVARYYYQSDFDLIAKKINLKSNKTIKINGQTIVIKGTNELIFNVAGSILKINAAGIFLKAPSISKTLALANPICLDSPKLPKLPFSLKIPVVGTESLLASKQLETASSLEVIAREDRPCLAICQKIKDGKCLLSNCKENLK